MHIVVFANGEQSKKTTLEEFTKVADLIVAADGGVNKALDSSISPDLIIGDMDSIFEDSKNRLQKSKFLTDKNPQKTDLEKTIEFCLAKGATSIDILCANGGRGDHALANLSILVRFGKSARIRIIDDFFETELITDEMQLKEPLGTIVSLVAIGACQGVTTTGFRWNLSEANLKFSTQGIHNEIVSAQATIKVGAGDMLLFKGRWIEKHT
tara:strand:+ start:6975 stop:7607 length:633 start_codon:yes stop_codon:yes gene_type:complete